MLIGPALSYSTRDDRRSYKRQVWVALHRAPSLLRFFIVNKLHTGHEPPSHAPNGGILRPRPSQITDYDFVLRFTTRLRTVDHLTKFRVYVVL